VADALVLVELLAGGLALAQRQHIGVDDESRLVGVGGRREQVDEVDEVGLGVADRVELVGDALVIVRVLDVGDVVVVELAELGNEALVSGLIDRVGADVGDVLQPAAQLAAELALDEPVEEQREQDAEQRADPEEGDGELASEPHVPRPNVTRR